MGDEMKSAENSFAFDRSLQRQITERLAPKPNDLYHSYQIAGDMHSLLERHDLDPGLIESGSIKEIALFILSERADLLKQWFPDFDRNERSALIKDASQLPENFLAEISTVDNPDSTLKIISRQLAERRLSLSPILALFLLAIAMVACNPAPNEAHAQEPTPAAASNTDSSSGSYNRDAQAVAPSIAPRVEQPAPKSVEIQQIGGESEIIGDPKNSIASFRVEETILGEQLLPTTVRNAEGKIENVLVPTPIQIKDGTIVHPETIAYDDGKVSVEVSIDGIATTITLSLEQVGSDVEFLQTTHQLETGETISASIAKKNLEALNTQREAELAKLLTEGEEINPPQEIEMDVVSIRTEPSTDAPFVDINNQRTFSGQVITTTKTIMTKNEDGSYFLWAQHEAPTGKVNSSGKPITTTAFSALKSLIRGEDGTFSLGTQDFTLDDSGEELASGYVTLSTEITSPSGGRNDLSPDTTTQVSVEAIEIELEAIKQALDPNGDLGIEIIPVPNEDGLLTLLLSRDRFGEEQIVGFFGAEGSLQLAFDGADKVQETVGKMRQALEEQAAKEALFAEQEQTMKALLPANFFETHPDAKYAPEYGAFVIEEKANGDTLLFVPGMDLPASVLTDDYLAELAAEGKTLPNELESGVVKIDDSSIISTNDFVPGVSGFRIVIGVSKEHPVVDKFTTTSEFSDAEKDKYLRTLLEQIKPKEIAPGATLVIGVSPIKLMDINMMRLANTAADVSLSPWDDIISFEVEEVGNTYIANLSVDLDRMYSTKTGAFVPSRLGYTLGLQAIVDTMNKIGNPLATPLTALEYESEINLLNQVEFEIDANGDRKSIYTTMAK